MTRSILIDDEEGAREALANILLTYFPDVEIIGKADSAKKGVEMICSLHPELVFLDIEMPGGNAFDLLSSPALERVMNFEVIFVTAFDHYALQAIKYSALDYLLKPVDMDELKKALLKYEGKKNEKNFFKEKLSVLLNNVTADTHRKIAIPDVDGLTFITVEEIIRCESDGNYTIIHTSAGKKMLSSRTLSEYDDLLSGGNFFRVHRSHLINLHHIKKYYRGEGGYVVMSDESQIEVSRRKKNEFIEWVGK